MGGEDARSATPSEQPESGRAFDAPGGWRDKVLHGFLNAITALALVDLLATGPVLYGAGESALIAVYVALFALLVALCFARRMPHAQRLAGTLFVGYASALAWLLGERRVPDFGAAMFGLTSLAALLGGKRWGYAALATSTVAFVAAAVAHVRGWIPPPPASSADMTLAFNWVSFGLDGGVYAVALCFSMLFVIARLEDALGRARELTRDLREQVRRRDDAIAARDAAEERLLASQKAEVIGKLAGGVAHDFNNLLTVMILGIETVPRGGDPRAEAALTAAYEAAQQAARVTKQLLAFSRRAVVEPRPCDFAGLVRASERVASRVLPEDVALLFELDTEAAVAAVVDEVQFHQALFNLILNARDALPKGGTIWVRTRAEGERAIVEVEDTGVGMDDATRARIFEPFFTTKPAGHGTGLGMSTTSALVEQYGGDVRVWSALGAGTRVTLSFPRYEGEAPCSVAPASIERASGGIETVLVVDDDIRVRAVICSALQEAGYVVHDAPNGEAALAVARRIRSSLDLLITDVVMPVVDGPELARALREAVPGVRVLFCSGYTPDDQLRRGVLEGAVALLQKPFARQELLAKVRAVLDAAPVAPRTPEGGVAARAS